jgi:hypothetical protein
MLHKLYESRRISFYKICQWSKVGLSKRAFSEIEAALLAGVNFELPAINPDWTEAEIEKEVRRI